MHLQPSVAAHTATTAPLVRWLGAIADQQNFALAPPDDSALAVSIGALLTTLAAEFSEYRAIAGGARSAARTNAEELARVVQATLEQGSLVRATASAAGQAGRGAELMAGAADALLGFAQAAAGSANAADTGLAQTVGALGELHCRLDEGRTPLRDMRSATDGVADFLVTLARLSRHAQLLAVNASIEAAHLAEAGSRFAIVAQEVRTLSRSTRDSRADVVRIVAELREATNQVANAGDDSLETTAAASREIEGAAEALSRTGTAIATFERTVMTVADVAATQSMALQAVTTAVEQIAQHADAITVASREAGQLDLDALLARAAAKAACWTLPSGRTATSTQPRDDEFGRWIATLIAGRPAAVNRLERRPELESLARAVDSLLTRVNADQREVLGSVVQVAVAVSRNGYVWRSIGESLTGVSREIGIVRETVDESTRGARTSAELARQMRTLVETIRAQYDEALASLEIALARITRIAASVHGIDGFVESMNGAASRAEQIMTLIETLSSETDLLSLNAAIEAAHAGEAGRGFSVIAEEIRALARSTNTATESVSQLVADIMVIGGTLQSSTGTAASATLDVTASAQQVRDAIAALRSAFDSATQRALDVSAAAADQTRDLDSVLQTINRTSTAFESNGTSATGAGRLQLAMLGARAHAVAARRPIGTAIEGVRTFGAMVCERLEAAIEAALAANRVSLESLFDFQYSEVSGARTLSLARLFDVSRVPDSGFTPIKYATPWDDRIDAALCDVLESVYDAAAAFSPVAMFVSDLNGFLYAYPHRKIAAWTNDPAVDNASNRIKRMFEDEYALRVGRWGLGEAAADLAPRTTWQTFCRSNCNLERETERPWGAFVYARDTNVVCNEVVMALYAGGRRHSTLRICYDANVI